MNDAPIHAVLWDFGGVILSSPFEAFNRYEQEAGLPPDFIRRINSQQPDHNAWARMERGELDRVGFIAAFEAEALALGHRVDAAHVLAIIGGEIRPEMVEALKRVRQRYRTACITNNMPVGQGTAMARSSEQARQISEVLGLFETVVESSKLNIRKPDPRIYTHTCELLGVEPEHCVYLDDLGINLKPAKAMGMRTIKVVSAAQALGELETYLGWPLR